MNAERVNDQEGLVKFALTCMPLRVSNGAVLFNTVKLLYQIVNLSSRQIHIRSYLDLIRSIQMAEAEAMLEGNAEYSNLTEEERKRVILSMQSTADEFMIAAAWLQVEIGKLGAMYYLRGMSPDYRETKRNRTLIDLSDVLSLSALSTSLSRAPMTADAEKSTESEGLMHIRTAAIKSAEMDVILSGYNRLSHNWNLANMVTDVVQALNTEIKAAVVARFRLTHTDFDTIMRMAKRQKIMPNRVRRTDPENSYELHIEHHEHVKKIAEERGVTPRRALNMILKDFFEMTARSQRSRID